MDRRSLYRPDPLGSAAALDRFPAQAGTKGKYNQPRIEGSKTGAEPGRLGME